MTESDDPETPKWQIVLGIGAFALLVALVTPITPSKTGSDWSMAELFFDDPGYLAKVAVDFVAVSLLIGLLAAVLVVYMFVQRRRSK